MLDAMHRTSAHRSLFLLLRVLNMMLRISPGASIEGKNRERQEYKVRRPIFLTGFWYCQKTPWLESLFCVLFWRSKKEQKEKTTAFLLNPIQQQCNPSYAKSYGRQALINIYFILTKSASAATYPKEAQLPLSTMY